MEASHIGTNIYASKYPVCGTSKRQPPTRTALEDLIKKRGSDITVQLPECSPTLVFFSNFVSEPEWCPLLGLIVHHFDLQLQISHEPQSKRPQNKAPCLLPKVSQLDRQNAFHHFFLEHLNVQVHAGHLCGTNNHTDGHTFANPCSSPPFIHVLIEVKNELTGNCTEYENM